MMTTSTSSSGLSRLATSSLFGMKNIPCFTADTVSCFLMAGNAASSDSSRQTLRARLARSEMVASCRIAVIKSKFLLVFTFTLTFLAAFLRSKLSSIYIASQIIIINYWIIQITIILITLPSFSSQRQYAQQERETTLRQMSECFYLQLFIVMGNACQNCEKPTNTRDTLKPELLKEEDKVGKAVEPTDPPIRPSLSKNDAKYFDNHQEESIEKTGYLDQKQKREPVKFKNGVIYDGQWRGNIREGFGVQVWPDGAKYEGQWENGKANGKGKFTHIDGDIYDGEWKDDKASGYGIYRHYNGAKYEGEWLDDYQHGKGVETWVDGSKYDGYYYEGKKNGEGKYTWKDNSYYSGTWKDNKINGFGTYVWSDGRQYKGQWLNNQMHGKGQYKWRDGRRYSGDYKHDKKHGLGTYVWTDGRQYVGEWVNSKRHGQGKIISLDGSERQGIWEQDRRVKWLDDSKAAGVSDSKTVKHP